MFARQASHPETMMLQACRKRDPCPWHRPYDEACQREMLKGLLDFIFFVLAREERFKVSLHVSRDKF
jgi:hypothetical protein